MAMKNQETGLYEARRTLSTGHEYVGVGSTKEEAKEDLAKQLKEIEIDYGPFKDEAQRREIQRLVLAGRIPKYQPPMKQVGTMRSPGFEMKIDEDGKHRYEFNPDKTAPVMTRDLTARQAVKSQSNI